MNEKLEFYDNGQKELTIAEIINVQEKKTELILRREALLAGTVQSRAWKNVGVAAQMELDRRAAARTENLAKKTTWIATIVGALAVIIGAVLGAMLTS